MGLKTKMAIIINFVVPKVRGVPFVWVLSFLYLIVLENLYPPTEQTFLSFIVWVVVVVDGGGRIYLWNFLGVSKWFFFLNVFSYITAYDFCKFVGAEKKFKVVPPDS